MLIRRQQLVELGVRTWHYGETKVKAPLFKKDHYLKVLIFRRDPLKCLHICSEINSLMAIFDIDRFVWVSNQNHKYDELTRQRWWILIKNCKVKLETSINWFRSCFAILLYIDLKAEVTTLLTIDILNSEVDYREMHHRIGKTYLPMFSLLKPSLNVNIKNADASTFALKFVGTKLKMLIL